MIAFGGDPNCACTKFNDVWVLLNANGLTGTPQWQPLAVAGVLPPPRSEHVSYYNPATNRLIIFGGFNCANGTLSDVWVLTNANGLGGPPMWTQLATGTGPGPRGRMIGGYDPASNRMFVYSGGVCCAWSPLATDLWLLTNADATGGVAGWTLLPQAGGTPGFRAYQAAHIYDPVTNRLTVYGTGASVNTDVWVLDNATGLGGTPTWSQLTVTGSGPVSPSHGSGSYDPSNQRMIVFSLQEVWVLAPTVIPVSIDIKPGSDPNSINCGNASDVVTVAILTTDDFDATTVDHTTVAFGPNGATETHVNRRTGLAQRHEEDVDLDGDTDLVFHFLLGDTGLGCDDTEGTLTGETLDGTPIEGADAVWMVP